MSAAGAGPRGGPPGPQDPRRALRAARLRLLAGRALIGLYPEPWRTRYGAELGALLEDDAPRAGGLASLFTGAARAHLRPRSTWRGTTSPRARMRLSVGAVFAAWIVLSMMGIGFQKVTEGGAYEQAMHSHPLLSFAHDAIIAGALLGAAAIAVAGLPLLWQAAARALARRDARLASLLALPLLGVLGFVGVARLLGALAPARHGGFPAAFVLATGLPWALAGIACAAVCALAPRPVMRRIAPSRAALRRASYATIPLLAAMAAITLALIAYAVELYVRAPSLAAEASGPIGASSGAMLAAGCAVAALSTALASLASARALRAARLPAAAS
jgi:hypothetical protein